MGLKGKDIFQICSTETVNALIIIPHNADVLILFRKCINQAELYIIGVLILIYQDIAEALLIPGKHFRKILKQLQGL